MKNFIIFIITLTVILVVVSLLLGHLMGVMIVGIITCLGLEVFEMEKQKHKDTK